MCIEQPAGRRGEPVKRTSWLHPERELIEQHLSSVPPVQPAARNRAHQHNPLCMLIPVCACAFVHVFICALCSLLNDYPGRVHTCACKCVLRLHIVCVIVFVVCTCMHVCGVGRLHWHMSLCVTRGAAPVQVSTALAVYIPPEIDHLSRRPSCLE